MFRGFSGLRNIFNPLLHCFGACETNKYLTYFNLIAMISYSFFATKANKLSVRFVNNRRKAELNLGIDASAADVADGLYALDKPKLKSRLKADLAYFKPRIEEIINRKTSDWPKDIDVKSVRDFVGRELGILEDEDEGQVKFTRHFQKFIDGKTNRGTKGIYKHTLDRIRAYDHDIDKKSFEDIDLKWLTDFENFCARTACKNARNIHLRNIRAVFNNAIDYELTTAYPFRRFKIRPEATRKRSLTVEELRRLFDYPVEPYAEIYRDCFKLIFMLIGINGADLHGLKSITKENRIEYKRAKTGRLYSIKVEPEAMEIINKYRGKDGLLCIADRWSDHRNFLHQCNKALQRIGTVERKGRGGKKIITAEFEGLTTYWARHTWATIAYNDLQIPKDIIAQALGHSGSETVTDIYLDKDPKLVDDANRRVLDWVLYGKC